MEIERLAGCDAVYDGLRELLLADEARHNLALGLLATSRSNPAIYPELGGWVVRQQGIVVAAALRTPPHNLILVRPSRPQAIEPLALAIDDEIPGVVGAVPEVDDFAEAWSRTRDVKLETRFDQRIYRLEEVRPTPTPRGRMRLATIRDLALVLERFRAFGDEVRHGPVDAGEDDPLPAQVENRLRANDAGVALWEHDGEVVSVAGFGGPTPNGIRIGPVHTPRDVRGNGYGTAVTAELTRLLLERGHRFCFLYTDLANPTSNAIYTRIGYEPVCESREIAFVPPAAA